MTENGGTTRILTERIKVLSERVDGIESDAKERTDVLNTMLLELRVLQTRVSLYAGAIGGGTGLAAAVLVKVLS